MCVVGDLGGVNVVKDLVRWRWSGQTMGGWVG
jgi:hypothetical protein